MHLCPVAQPQGYRSINIPKIGSYTELGLNSHSEQKFAKLVEGWKDMFTQGRIHQGGQVVPHGGTHISQQPIKLRLGGMLSYGHSGYVT